MQNVLYIELSSGFGGSSEALYHHLKHYDKENFAPFVVVTHHGPNFDKIKNCRIPVIEIKLYHLEERFRNNLIAYLRAFINLLFDVCVNSLLMLSLIKKHRIDLVHINTNIKNNLPSILAAKLAKIPCVSHMRGTRPLIKTEKIFGRLIDAIIILNRPIKEIMHTHFPSKRIELIPDGVDMANIPLDQSQKFGIREEFRLNNHFCVGIIGRLVEGKGQDDFIEAARIIHQKYPHARFLVVGSNPDGDDQFAKRIKERVRELELDQTVIFTGWRLDKYDIIQSLDLVVQASSTFPEGAPLIISEAMALGKPVVATHIPGSSEMVEDGKTGFLVPPANPEAMAAAMIKLIEAPLMAKEFGTAGTRKVRECFDIAQNVKKMEALYLDLLGRKPKSEGCWRDS